ncbi:TPA: carbohydate-binding domain-containing protein [Aeromonas salmonicida]|uniref:beta-N-acetylhexosaminidase n=2 Tax=Aeromonas salmonicida subsp. salmonicida TaxID=29491 RepID=A4SPN2_AERS4|nr:family 20 glycosylhydrolase [Aeromonas salmonicida]ABO90854.1 beta-N-acetylhexosaminidase [Aeromonas salmonicida subsp. salmonicida A449]AYO63910.1 beta-N-acetylglucosaminidase [Aeromonas salmonicida subsp. salmonicida 01-B526]EHI53130.1 beta-N-acetylhexosaminidase [Aeromonas salmonicida subsp. salmonicida 01-B526]EKP0241318.1 carbohydate-binding domain-containing protein [Aeromonas salmonicida]EKP0245462.1 carbohydate-binding domain-containing protein [Aeromonas salmonicida]
MRVRRSLVSMALAMALTAPAAMAMTQSQLDGMGQGVDLKYQVIDNTLTDGNSFRASITLRNNTAQPLPATGWSLWFSHIRDVSKLYTDQFKVTHVNGDIFKLEPTAQFRGVPAGQSFEIAFDGGNWQVAKSDVMPNWYFAAQDAKGNPITALLASTSNTHNGVVPTEPSAELPFVGDFSTPKQWKRYNGPSNIDRWNPFTAAERYARNADLSVQAHPVGVVPTPAELQLATGNVTLGADWVVVFDNGYEEQARWLAANLGLPAQSWSPNTSKVIRMGWGQVQIDGQAKWEEAYRLKVDSKSQTIQITAADAAGALYAAQSLLQLEQQRVVPALTIADAPRFAYRGLSLDASRNFRSKQAVLALPELTDVGARRCHDPAERTCILPFLGAGPNGTAQSDGFYSADDYREILSHAKALNIEVIPEIDMPGHAHAAIKAMDARSARLNEAGQPQQAAEYRLSDPDDRTDYTSVQMFKDNAMNVCMESTYRFIDTVVGELVALYQGIQPLKTFHFGGDEVAGAWKQSPACQAFFANNSQGIKDPSQLSQYFVERVSGITSAHGLNMGGWEDGLMHDNKVYPRSNLANALVSGNAWQNIWEWGVADRAYKLANAGYGVIYNQASHLYFDHPNEPDPAERGYYWAPRFTDTRKTFGFMPDDLFANADYTRAGKPITKAEVVDGATTKTLEQPANVLGMQGSLWAETVRTDNQFEEMLFPRVFALAERAWHKAGWEANSPFPGLTIQYSIDGGSWQAYDAANAPSVSGKVVVRTASGLRAGRNVVINN